MAGKEKMITVGVSHCWDTMCRGENLIWDSHEQRVEQSIQPAGKAINISRTLAWIGRSSTITGLWGADDHRQMLRSLSPLKRFVKLKCTVVPGRTRQNITIVDTAKCREIHMRFPSELISTGTLKLLQRDLTKIVTRNSYCIWAGSMGPDQYQPEILRMLGICLDLKARLVIDTSGSILEQIVSNGNIWVMKPNVSELRSLLGENIADRPISLAKAGKQLLSRVRNVLISRADKGAILVTKGAVFRARCLNRQKKVHSTVGCGDALLAGFLHGLVSGSSKKLALRTALQAATAKAWDLTDSLTWNQARKSIKVDVQSV
jgi:1-phosphofructokinase family hexose kinase